MKKIAPFALLALLLSSGLYAGNPPKYDHVLIVVMENHPYSDIIGSSSAPYINAMADSGALFTSSYAITHPSQPNYLALFSGSTQGVSDDNIPAGSPFTTANLAHSLLASGYTFKGYSETEPSKGFTGGTSGKYARKHAPWVNWQGAGTNQLPDSINLPYTYFPVDYTKLPTVSFVIPNLNDDMHDGTITQGDNWLKNNLDSFKRWTVAHNSLLIVTWDEDDNGSSNQIATLFYGAHVLKGRYSETINHYAVLRTLLDMYSVTPFANAASDSAIHDCWTYNSDVNDVFPNHYSLNIIPRGRQEYTIQFESGIPAGKVKANLYDMMGHLCYSESYPSAKEHQCQLPANLSTGMYFIEVNAPGVDCRKKIEINK